MCFVARLIFDLAPRNIITIPLHRARCYHEVMKSDTPEMRVFTRTMRGLLAVSKDELNEKLAEYEREKKARKASRASSHVSNDRSAKR